MIKTLKKNLDRISPKLSYKDGELYLENVNLNTLVQQELTPNYIYSKAQLLENLNSYQKEFESDRLTVCFSAKANSNIHILRDLSSEGAGLDIVSGGELSKALLAGMDPKKIVFSGVCKTEDEIQYAISSDILMINAESESELNKINQVATNMGKTACVSIRINPGVDPKTHPYISTGFKKNKFGVSEEEAGRMIKRFSEYTNIKLLGITCHIGSQLTDLKPFSEAIDKVLEFIDSNKLNVEYLDIGGGLGVCYYDEEPPKISDYASMLKEKFQGRPMKIIIEPGRSIIANAGIMIGRVHYIKDNGTRKFYLSDIGMNDIARPSLYKAFHGVIPLKDTQETEVVDIVGPICESSDVLIEQKEVAKLGEGDYFAVLSTGAYGHSMASNYNSRPKGAEILVDNDQYEVITKRQTYEDLIKGELL